MHSKETEDRLIAKESEMRQASKTNKIGNKFFKETQNECRKLENKIEELKEERHDADLNCEEKEKTHEKVIAKIFDEIKEIADQNIHRQKQLEEVVDEGEKLRDHLQKLELEKEEFKLKLHNSNKLKEPTPSLLVELSSCYSETV